MVQQSCWQNPTREEEGKGVGIHAWPGCYLPVLAAVAQSVGEPGWEMTGCLPKNWNASLVAGEVRLSERCRGASEQGAEPPNAQEHLFGGSSFAPISPPVTPGPRGVAAFPYSTHNRILCGINTAFFCKAPLFSSALPHRIPVPAWVLVYSSWLPLLKHKHIRLILCSWTPPPLLIKHLYR